MLVKNLLQIRLNIVILRETLMLMKKDCSFGNFDLINIMYMYCRHIIMRRVVTLSGRILDSRLIGAGLNLIRGTALCH